MRITGLFLLAFLVTGLWSCKKEKQPLTWTTDNYFPVANGSLNFSSIVPDSLLSTQSDSSVHFKLEENLYTLNLDSIITIPDTSLTDTFAIPFSVPVTISPGQTFINQPADNLLAINDVELKNVYINDAVITYSLSSTIQGDVIYIYSLPSSADAGGLPFEQQVFVPAAPSGGHSHVSGSFHVTGYEVNLQGSTGNDVNILQTSINVKVSESNNGTVTVSQNDTLYVENSIQSIKIGSAEGYFGQFSSDFGPETSAFNMFNSIISGGINLTSVNADFIISNGVGADLGFQLNTLSAENTTGSVQFQNTLIGQTQHINRAYKTGTTIVPGIYQTTFNQNNSNIAYLIEMLPNQLSYAGSLSLNPMGNVSGGNDFIDEHSPLTVDLNMDIPLQLSVNQLTFQDTVGIVDSIFDQVNSLSLHIDLDNGFPLNAELHIGLLDQNNMLVEQVVSNNIIPKATYQQDLKHTFTTHSFHLFELTPYQVSLLKNNPNMVIKVKLDSDSSDVTIYDYYKMNYKIDAYINNDISIGN